MLTPVAAVVIKAINQEEFAGFSFVNNDYGRMLDMTQLSSLQITTQTSVTNTTSSSTNTAPKPATQNPGNTPKTIISTPGGKLAEPLQAQKGTGSFDLPSTPSPKIQLTDTPPKLSVASKSMSSSLESNESCKPVTPPVNVTQPCLDPVSSNVSSTSGSNSATSTGPSISVSNVSSAAPPTTMASKTTTSNTTTGLP